MKMVMSTPHMQSLGFYMLLTICVDIDSKEGHIILIASLCVFLAREQKRALTLQCKLLKDPSYFYWNHFQRQNNGTQIQYVLSRCNKIQ